MPFALLSVSDKSNIIEFAQKLIAKNYKILSSGGTFKCLQEAGVEATEVGQYTGFEQIMGGRVKTLHPKVHGGILGRRDVDQEVMAKHEIECIDLVCVNLYPFKATIEKPDATYEMAIENIDIGGPAMIRAAAKNHKWVSVVVDPTDYDNVIETMNDAGEVEFATKQRLAQKAFAHTAEYDARIQAYLLNEVEAEKETLPETLNLLADKIQDLRYGENSHQKAAFYKDSQAPKGTIAGAELVQGKPMSYNNIADADAALACVRELAGTGCVIVKHANPCGAATGSSLLEAYEKAYATDPTAAFGGIIAFNKPLDLETTQTILDRQFVEVILAPAISDDAVQALTKKPNLRVLITGELEASAATAMTIKSVSGGFLVQEDDVPSLLAEEVKFEVVTERQPTEKELEDLKFAWTLVKYVKSNAIVFAKDGSSTGIGAGQMSRVFAAQIAQQKAGIEGLSLENTVVASDAFFPFRDGVDAVVAAGATAIVQPGGSVRDEEVIAAANEAGVAMVFTGNRHFRH